MDRAFDEPGQSVIGMWLSSLALWFFILAFWRLCAAMIQYTKLVGRIYSDARVMRTKKCELNFELEARFDMPVGDLVRLSDRKARHVISLGLRGRRTGAIAVVIILKSSEDAKPAPQYLSKVNRYVRRQRGQLFTVTSQISLTYYCAFSLGSQVSRRGGSRGVLGTIQEFRIRQNPHDEHEILVDAFVAGDWINERDLVFAAPRS